MTDTARRLGATPTPAALDRVKRPAGDDLVAAVAALLESAVKQIREEKDAAIEGLVVMITDLRSDNAVMAARLDRLDPPEQLPGFVTLKQAAGVCGYTCEAVRQWAAAGQVTATKTGGRVSVELSSVLARAARRG